MFVKVAVSLGRPNEIIETLSSRSHLGLLRAEVQVDL